MTKFLTTSLVILFTGLLASAQSQISVTVIDASTGLPASGQFIAFQIYPSGGIPPNKATQEGITDQNGNLSIQYVSNLSGNQTLVSMGYDCNNQYITDTTAHDFSQSTNFNDTLFLPCGVNMNCDAKLNITPDPLDSLTVTIELDTSVLSGLPPHHDVYLGDWTIAQENPHFVVDSLYATGQQSLSYTFPGPGEYSICHLSSVWDSTLMISRPCLATVCDTISVPMPDTSFCQALYSGDTSTSNAGLITLINASVPSVSDSTYNTSFVWDFGDGYTSNQAYPVHVYDSSGVYEVCLNITSTDQLQNTCTSTYCDSVGVDSLGNVIMKKSQQGFTLRVIDPKTVSNAEFDIMPKLQVFPNPASESLFLESSQLMQPGSFYGIYDLSGSIVHRGELNPGAETHSVQIDVSFLPAGSYVLQLSSPNGVQQSVQIQVLKN